MAKVISRPTCPGFDPFTQAYVKDPQAWLHAVPGGAPPVFYYEPLDFWVLTRHADVRSAFADSATFSSTAFRAIPGSAVIALTDHRRAGAYCQQHHRQHPQYGPPGTHTNP